MLQTEENVLIVYSVDGTPPELITEARKAINTYVHTGSLVIPVQSQAIVFEVPPSSSPGASLGSELTRRLQTSLGAIVFIDDLRPNVAYELGFFHGRGRDVLLVSQEEVGALWRAISDIAGSALLNLSRRPLTPGVHDYLAALYRKLATIPPFPTPTLPLRSRNMLAELASRAQIEVALYESDFGDAMRVDTWGGVVFDVWRNLLPDAKFKVVVRALAREATYSLYFRVRFRDIDGARRTIYLGLTSNQESLGFEANERNIPAQAATSDWSLLTGSFSDLLEMGQVLGVRRVEHLEVIRVRAGGYREDPTAANPAYEIGYFEIIGVDR